MTGAEARFAERVALVTGTGKPNGIGWATAKILGNEGAFVAAGVRKPEDAEILTARLAEQGIKGIGIEIDLTRGLRRAKPGRVVSVSSVVGLHGHAGQTNYAAANAAMIAWTKSLAHEYEGKGLHFNAFAPGVVDTDMTRGALEPEQWEALLAMIPSGEPYQPDEIASGIIDLLASDKNGHVEVMDGGISKALERSE
jgi:NAD(P)-dependent dehydrogenase (short-subunit alcohol dehydrogenase family)